VTNEGVNWVIRSMRELDNYNTFIQRAVNNIAVCAAVAEDGLNKGQAVGLKMKDGLLFASSELNGGATAVTTSNARPGEDIGVSNVSGIIPLEIGRVTILKVPGIEHGGSNKVDYTALKKYVSNGHIVIALGLEAITALRKIDAGFQQFGAADTAIEAAKCGLDPLVVCVESETSSLVTRLDKEHIRCQLVDIAKP
jgi:putative transcriptional regulator